LIICATLLEKLPNFGHLARTSEVFSLESLVVNNKNIVDDDTFKAISMSSEKWLPIHEVKENDLINYLIM
jgi:hypothetical protein